MKSTVNEAGASEGARKLFVGAFNMHVGMVNPNLETLKKAGSKLDKEPDYFLRNKDNKDVVEGMRILVFLENMFREDKVKTAVTFYLRKEFIVSKKDPLVDRFQYIDQFGKTCFLSEQEFAAKEVKFNWIDIPSLKKALKGEAEIIEFLRCLANCGQSDPMMFEAADTKLMFTGNLAPMLDVINKARAKENSVRVMLGISEKEGKVYQTAYARKFEFAWSNSSKYMHKSLMDNKSFELKSGNFFLVGDTYNEVDFFIREFDPQTERNKLTYNPAGSSAMPGAVAGGPIPSLIDNGVDETLFATAGNDDDLPF